MNDGLTMEFQVHFRHGPKGQRELVAGGDPSPPAAPVGRIPRVAKLLALAIRMDELIRAGQVTDFAELARMGHVTRSRMSQIMALLNLAPDIQEAILFLPPVVAGRDPIGEHDLRPIAAAASWEDQREIWCHIILPMLDGADGLP